MKLGDALNYFSTQRLMGTNQSLIIRYIHAAAYEAYPEFVVDELLPMHDGYMTLAIIGLSTSEVLRLCIGAFCKDGVEIIILYLYPIGYNTMPTYNFILLQHKVRNVDLVSLDPSDPEFINKILRKIWEYISLNCCITEH